MLTESNKLILSADNIGFSIKAEITSLDPNHKGVALVYFFNRYIGYFLKSLGEFKFQR